jgi:hypothetical protein
VLSQREIEEEFEEKALAGNGAFAIAYALLQCAQAQEKQASVLEQFGSTVYTKGLIEGGVMKLAESLEKLAEYTGSVGDSIEKAADTLSESLGTTIEAAAEAMRPEVPTPEPHPRITEPS